MRGEAPVNPITLRLSARDPSAPAGLARVKRSSSTTDASCVFEYALMLRYPNGRIFVYHKESDRPLSVGYEFDAFGRRWKLERELRPNRNTPDSLRGLKAFACSTVVNL